MTRILALFCLALSLSATVLSGPARAESYDDIISAELRPGWRLPDGDHMAALHLRLAPGWKTYWRSPGDAGIPPAFSWSGARNAQSVTAEWPAPTVFWQSGMRSVGYKSELVLPLRVSLKQAGRDARLGGVIEIGICKDVCLPHTVRVSAELPADVTRPDPVIASALATRPFSADEAGVRSVTCRLTPEGSGLRLQVAFRMPGATGREETVIETGNPRLWASDAETRREGGGLVAESVLRHESGGALALDRSDLRITVLGGRMPVEIRGCAG